MPVDQFTPLYTNYDKAVVDWVHSLKYEDKPLLTVFATPERALAQVERLVRERAGTKPTVTPLPFASINNTADIYDFSRFINGTMRREFQNSANNNYVQVKRPQPINLVYQVSIWARLLRDLKFYQGQILTRLRANEVYLTVGMPPPFNELIARMELNEIRDISSKSPGGDQRILRRLFQFTVNAWVSYEPVEVKRIEKVQVEVYESDDLVTKGDLFDTVVEI